MSNVRQPNLAFLIPDSEGTSIKRYHDCLANGYNAQGIDLMQKYKVKNLYHCKEHSEIGHEYVVAEIAGPQHTEGHTGINPNKDVSENSEKHENQRLVTPFYIIFERFRGPKDQGTNGTAPGRRSSDSGTAVFQIVSEVVQSSSELPTDALRDMASSSLQDRLASDRVSMSTSSSRNSGETYQTFTFRKKIPFLYELVVLAFTIHQLEVNYDISKASCYFYAAAIMQVMEALYTPETSKNQNWRWSKVGRVPKFKKTPLYKVFSTTKIEANNVHGIVDLYNVNLNDFVNEAKVREKQLLEEARRTATVDDLYQEEKKRANREAKLREAEAVRASQEAARASQEAMRANKTEAENRRLRRELAMLQSEKGNA